MRETLSELYPWTKSLHIISMVAWMAGLLYLPRIFVYHAESDTTDKEPSNTFRIMEIRLLRFIMNPAMIATWFFGLLLILTPGVVDFSVDYWIYIKLTFVGVMTWFHHWLALRVKEFARNNNVRSGRTFRLMNELPTLALIIIVIMVVVRPV